MNGRLVLALVCAPLAGSSLVAAQAPAPAVLWRDVRSSEASALDLVFLPDGFRAEDQAAFEASARKAIDGLERGTASFVRARREAWNIHVAFVPSLERCPSRPGEPPADSAFSTHVEAESEGGMIASDDEAIAAAARALAPGVDGVVVIVRSSRRLGFATGDLPLEGGRVRLPEGMEYALLHELGHSLFALGDEYAARRAPFPAYECTVVPFYPNVTLDPSGARFAVGGKAPELTEGALDFQRGIFRVAGPCVMQDAGGERFCAACAAVIQAGRPAAAPALGPGLEVVRAPQELTFALHHAPAEAGIVRAFAVLFRLAPDGTPSDDELRARFQAAHARVSRKTRYMESPWIGDGSLEGERVFSLEPQVAELAPGKLEPGRYALVAASANLLGLSPSALVRFEVDGEPQNGR